MNNKLNPRSNILLWYLSFCLIPLLLLSSCGGNEAADDEPAPDFTVLLADNNDDESPDGWTQTGPTNYFSDYQITFDTTTGHNDSASLLIQNDKELPEEAFGATFHELSRLNIYKGSRLQFSGYIKQRMWMDGLVYGSVWMVLGVKHWLLTIW